MADKNDFPLVHVAVALIIKNEREMLWTVNRNWGAFTLPMTKRRVSQSGLEPAEQAAARAGAEVLGVPVRVGAHWATRPELKVSGRDGAVRRYAYEIFRVDPHPDFAHALERPDLLWLTEEQVFGGNFRPPVSHSSADIVTQLLLDGRIPRRTQQTATVIVQQLQGSQPHFLLRWNPDWGFALPSKRMEAQEPPQRAAERVLTDELQLQPGTEVKLHAHALPRFTTYSVSPSAGVDTFYVHWLFDGELLGAKQPNSSEADLPVVLASKQDIRNGRLDATSEGVRQGKAEPGMISPTVRQIILGLDDDLPWIES